jgi:HPt (histidine-containing phosphotransfer) domain-containing protein
MDGYLSKPIDTAVLFATVEQIGLTGSPEPSCQTGAALPFDRDALLARVGGDMDLFVDVVQLFLADCPVRLAGIKAAVDAKDPERICLAAHALKGAAGNLSAIPLMGAARALERIGAERRLDAADAAFRDLSVQAVMAMDALRSSTPLPVERS